jgi:hypothetical protein
MARYSNHTQGQLNLPSGILGVIFGMAVGLIVMSAITEQIMSKWAKQRDMNERFICGALRKIPWPPGDQRRGTCPRVTVQPIEGATQHTGASLPKAGTPDLLVGCDGVTHLVEVKGTSTKTTRTTQTAIRSRFAGHLERWGMALCRQLRPNQHEWLAAWTGGPVHVVTTALDAFAALGLCGLCGVDADAGLCEDRKCQGQIERFKE